MWQGVDRRRFPRAKYRCKITIFKKGKKEELDTYTENIGLGGICTVTKKALDKFSMVGLVLYLENGYSPIECDGRVIWAIKRKEEFDTGIEFIGLKKQDLLRIERIVQECLKKLPDNSSQET